MVEELQRKNERNHFIYRCAMLVIYLLIVILYISPVPAYLKGEHPKSHLTFFLHKQDVVGTVDDLTYLPAFPIYAFVASIEIAIIAYASYELAEIMNLVRSKGFSFPAQPHPFGTAPNWVVPVLRDLRLQSSKTTAADPSKQSQNVEITRVLPPRVVYVGFLWVCTWPAPLLSFGAGAFDDALWWLFPFLALTVHVLIEYWMYKADTETLGLNNLKYNHKGA